MLLAVSCVQRFLSTHTMATCMPYDMKHEFIGRNVWDKVWDHTKQVGAVAGVVDHRAALAGWLT